MLKYNLFEPKNENDRNQKHKYLGFLSAPKFNHLENRRACDNNKYLFKSDTFALNHIYICSKQSSFAITRKYI